MTSNLAKIYLQNWKKRLENGWFVNQYNKKCLRRVKVSKTFFKLAELVEKCCKSMLDLDPISNAEFIFSEKLLSWANVDIISRLE